MFTLSTGKRPNQQGARAIPDSLSRGPAAQLISALEPWSFHVAEGTDSSCCRRVGVESTLFATDP
jgi:hypothetical protein